MSETTIALSSGAPSSAAMPEASAEPVVTTTEATTPVETGAATETTTEQTEKPNRVERRIAALSARMSAGEQERAQLAAENAALRAKLSPEPAKPISPADIPRIVEERVTAEVQRRENEGRVKTFHDAGKAAFPDWQDRCESLMQMGADAQMAELLIELPDGPKVAAALADDPDELERIAGLKSERARAIALGKYSAQMALRPAAAAPAVSKAPPPIRPISGVAKVAFNESTATAAQLVEHYSKQAMEKRAARR